MKVFLLLCIRLAFGCDTGCVYFQAADEVWHYNGNVSKTVTRQSCVAWTTDKPEVDQVAGTNFCRNSNGDDNHPWCYFANIAGAWEYCDVGVPGCPICNNPVIVPSPAPMYKTKPCIAPEALAPGGQDIQPRIVGGAVITPHEFPFFAAVQYKYSSGWGVWCGGVLVHPDWVLTATHCTLQEPAYTANISVSNLRVKIGLQYANDDPNINPCVEVRTITQFVRPSGFDVSTFENDLTFMRLNQSSSYPPAVLYWGQLGEDLEATFTMLTTLGQGALLYNQNIPTNPPIRKALVPVYDHSWCASVYPSCTSTAICAGYLDGTVDACQGDSGGPLFVKRGTVFYVIGITSTGYMCAEAGYPGLYTRLSLFWSWICAQPQLVHVCAFASSGSLSPTTAFPTRSPTTAKPTKSPTNRPSTRMPSSRPSRVPTTGIPTRSPTKLPTKRPTKSPATRSPTHQPTRRPTKSPVTRSPTKSPITRSPTHRPTRRPTKSPATRSPTKSPVTRSPTNKPTKRPTRSPITRSPTKSPNTRSPTNRPTKRPTNSPVTRSPTKSPVSRSPTNRPTKRPTNSPQTRSPTKFPTTRSPTNRPSKLPTRSPSTRSPTTSKPTLPTRSPTQLI